MVLDCLAVLAVAGLAEIVVEIAGGALKLPELEADKTTVAELFDVVGFDHQHHVDDGQGFVEGLRF